VDLWVLVLLLVAVQPLLGYYRFTRATARPGPIATARKLRLYAIVVASQWALTAICAWVLGRRGLDLADLGLRGAPPALAAIAAALATLAVLGGTFLSLRALARQRGAALPSHLAKVIRILPASRGERAGFAAVALTAGLCEEILYRGYLIYAFDRILPSSWWSMALAAALFGAAHAYQGARGMVSTGLLGGFLGGVYVAGGSLWPGIFLHAVVDLVNGYALGPLGGRPGPPAAAIPAPPPGFDAPPPATTYSGQP
jgi:membrane protease YdiL (CAAX protease family)